MLEKYLRFIFGIFGIIFVLSVGHGLLGLYNQIINIFKFIYFERDKALMGRSRERERERESQAGSALSAWSLEPTNHEMVT